MLPLTKAGTIYDYFSDKTAVYENPVSVYQTCFYRNTYLLHCGQLACTGA
jgi:hypothetical protein